MSDKPRVLILGGCGFIGRNFVKYLVDNDLTSHIKVADKSLPATSYLSPEFADVFNQKDKVKFQQCDLSRDAHAEKAFDGEFDYVFNLCGETRFGLGEEDYKKKCLDPAVACGKVAKTKDIKRFVEVSTAQVYKPDKTAADAESKCDPFTKVAKYRLQAEDALKEFILPLVVLRPAIVYGKGDTTGITPRLACAAVYRQKKQTMKFLWDKKLKINCVHVDDVCRAMWCAAVELAPGYIYNLEEGSDLDQGKLNEMLGDIFQIKTGFHNFAVNTAARVALGAVAEQANDDHLPAWSDLCKNHAVLNTPVTPYLDAEVLGNNNLSVNGTKITQDSSFQYEKQISVAGLRGLYDYMTKSGFFPDVLKE